MTRKKKYQLIEDYHLLSYNELDSTNDEARRLAEAGAAHGAMIWAKTQSAGKGRMGRSWVSEEGNLFVSVLLSPDMPLEQLSQLSIVSSLAVLETLLPIIGEAHRCRLKWPNDILLDEKKTGGILLESFEANDKRWVVAGIGINIDSFPPNVNYPATCLKAAGVELISAKIVLSRFIHHFIQCYDTWINEGFAIICERWKSHAFQFGETITVASGTDTLTGTFSDVDAEGHLCLKQANGNIARIPAGDVLAPGA